VGQYLVAPAGVVLLGALFSSLLLWSLWPVILAGLGVAATFWLLDDTGGGGGSTGKQRHTRHRQPRGGRRR
jgi:hypothetical protein